jgi:hypothetical protein
MTGYWMKWIGKENFVIQLIGNILVAFA